MIPKGIIGGLLCLLFMVSVILVASVATLLGRWLDQQTNRPFRIHRRR